MHDGLRLEREGGSTIEYLEFGTHRHAYVFDENEPLRKVGTDLKGQPVMESRLSVQEPCARCAAENDAFMGLQIGGSFSFEELMYKLPSYRAYHTRWPFDAREKVLSSELVFEEKDGAVYVEKPGDRSTLDELMDTEAVDELLIELTPDEKQVILLTGEGYKPREIAVIRHERTSASVRQLKYAALRKLGAPINTKMRRVK